MKISGSIILITGASSGIGRALSKVLAEKGAMLVLASREFGPLKNVAKDIESAFPHSPPPLAISCDVTKREDVRRLIRECTKHLGNIDVLINSAGISVYGDTERTTLEDFQSVMAVNFFGAINCMLEVIPGMKLRSKGLIVNIASLSAVRGVPYLGAYCASKAALVAVSQSLRVELSASGVSIMIAYPDYTETKIFSNEKKIGGAHRPPGPYSPAVKVAKVIARAIEKEKRDLFFSPKGRALALLQGLIPRLVEKVMQRIGYELSDKGKV